MVDVIRAMAREHLSKSGVGLSQHLAKRGDGLSHHLLPFPRFTLQNNAIHFTPARQPPPQITRESRVIT